MSRFSVQALLALAVPCLAYAQGGFNSPGRYEIANIKSGKVLDLDRNNQTTVIQFASRGTDNQTWEIRPASQGYFFFRNGMNGNALEATGSGNSTPLIGRPFNGGENQQWRIEAGKDGNALIISRNGKALDVPDGSDRDGVKIQLYDSNGDSNQRFTFRRLQGGNDGNFPGDNRGGNPGGNNGGGNSSGGNNGGGGNLLTCSSDSGSRVYCDADTRRGVRMVRQLSGSACREGATWGYDRRGVWVDRGCRAEFDMTGGTGGRQDASIVTCASDNGGRVNCDADTRHGVRLVRQLSGSACREGSSWGYDRRGVWVDRGCRAEFQLGGN